MSRDPCACGATPRPTTKWRGTRKALLPLLLPLPLPSSLFITSDLVMNQLMTARSELSELNNGTTPLLLSEHHHPPFLLLHLLHHERLREEEGDRGVVTCSRLHHDDGHQRRNTTTRAGWSDQPALRPGHLRQRCWPRAGERRRLAPWSVVLLVHLSLLLLLAPRHHHRAGTLVTGRGEGSRDAQRLVSPPRALAPLSSAAGIVTCRRAASRAAISNEKPPARARKTGATEMNRSPLNKTGTWWWWWLGVEEGWWWVFSCIDERGSLCLPRRKLHLIQWPNAWGRLPASASLGLDV